MWTRRELKDHAKQKVMGNYWMVVAVGVVYMFLSGQISINFNYGSSATVDVAMSQVVNLEDMAYTALNYVPGANGITSIAKFLLALSPILIALIIMSAVVFNIFVINPLQVGIRKFFIANEKGDGQIPLIFSSFNDPNYMNIVKIMFFKNFYTFLWTLCLIVPGIIKSYEYIMIPYILADDSSLDMDEVFGRTKQLTDNEKMNIFVLELSFILWNIASSYTYGLLGIFWVTPYYLCTYVALYDKLQDLHYAPDDPYIDGAIDERQRQYE